MNRKTALGKDALRIYLWLKKLKSEEKSRKIKKECDRLLGGVARVFVENVLGW